VDSNKTQKRDGDPFSLIDFRYVTNVFRYFPRRIWPTATLKGRLSFFSEAEQKYLFKKRRPVLEIWNQQIDYHQTSGELFPSSNEQVPENDNQ